MQINRMKLGIKNAGINERKFHWIVKTGLTLVMLLLFAILFYGQAAKHANGKYFSDLPLHIDIALKGGDYSLLYSIMGIVCSLPFPNVAIALFESGIVIWTFFLAEKHLRRHFDLSESWAMWISAGMLFLSSIYIPRIYHYYYIWSLLTQPWHNITYLGMRLFSIPAFFYTLEVLGRYRSRFTWKDWFVIALPLLLSAAIKPNFLVDYSFALLIVLIVDFVRDVFKKELTAVSFFRYVFLGTAVFPGVIVLFYQMTMLYGGEEAANNGMALVFLTSQYFSQGLFNTIIGIARDIAFPMLVVIYGYKYFSRKEKFVLLYFVVTLIQCIVLEETGLRADHGNFFWGMYNAGYLLFLYMVPKFIQLVKMTPWKQKNLWNRFLTVAGSGMLCMHLFFGLKYFWMLFNGKYFYI